MIFRGTIVKAIQLFPRTDTAASEVLGRFGGTADAVENRDSVLMKGRFRRILTKCFLNSFRCFVELTVFV